MLRSRQVRGEDPIDSISVVEDPDGDLLCSRGIVELSHCYQSLCVGFCLVGEDSFKRDLIHVLLLIHQAGCEGFLAVTVRAGGNVQKLRSEISTSSMSDLRNSSA